MDKHREKADYSLAGGILSMLAAFMSLLLGILFMFGGGVLSIIPAVFGVVAFVLGLWGGMLSFRRKNYTHAILGAWFPLFEGIIITLAIGSSGTYARWIGLTVAAPAIVPSLLSMALITESKTVFSQSKPSSSFVKRYCRYCGAENKTDANFCEKCGKSLR